MHVGCFENALLPLLTTWDATALRATCKTLRSVVGEYRWHDAEVPIVYIKPWQSCFPLASAARAHYDSLDSLIRAFPSMSYRLRELNLRETFDLRSFHMHDLIVAFEKSNSLVLSHLDLNSNHLDDVDISELVTFLRKSGAMSSLKSLLLSENSIEDDGAITLAEALEESVLPNLTKLDLGWNMIGETGIIAIANVIDKGAMQLLEALDLRGDYVLGGGLLVLFEALKKGTVPRLKALKVSDISDESMTVFAKVMEKSAVPLLETLHMQDGELSADGMRAFANSLQKGSLPMLKLLDLDDNKMGDGGVRALVEALEKGALPLLESLSLSGNKLHDDAMITLAKALANGAIPRLKVLSIANNKIQNRGARALLNVLRDGTLPMLKFLFTCANPASKLDEESMKRELQCRETKIAFFITLGSEFEF